MLEKAPSILPQPTRRLVAMLPARAAITHSFLSAVDLLPSRGCCYHLCPLAQLRAGRSWRTAMKALALTEGPNHVCYRYRIEAFASALAQRGWTLESLPLAAQTLQRSSQLRSASAADVVILQRRMLPLWQLRMLRKAAKVLVYDFDDALFYRDSYNRKGPLSWTRLAHFWATIYAADAVTAGNGYLREQAAAYIEPHRVHLVPTCVDP